MTPRRTRRKATAPSTAARSPKAVRPARDSRPLFRRPSLGDVPGVLAAALTYVAVARGIIFYLPLLQIPLIVGAVVGLTVRARGTAAVAAGLVVAAGVWIVPPFAVARSEPAQALLIAVAIAGGAAACAFVTQGLRSRGSSAPATGVAWGLVCLLVLNLWATTITLDSRPVTPDGRTAADMLREKPAPGAVWSDEDFYRQVLWLMSDDGLGFYEAFQSGYRQNMRWQRDPNTVFAVRPPTAFVVWRALPAKPWSLIVGYLSLATLAALAVAWLAQRRARAAFAVPAVAALLGLVLFVASSRMILNTEPWAVLLAIMSAAAGVASFGSGRQDRMLAVSVITATLAVLTRELFVYLFVAGIGSALLGSSDQRMKRLGSWSAGLAVILAAYAFHASAAAAIVSATGTTAQWFNGGVSNLMLGLRYATDYIGRTVLVPIVFAALALFGAYRARERGERTYLALTCALPLVGFLFFGSDAKEIATQASTNYWGMITVPVLVALSPLGLEALAERFDATGSDA